MKTWCDSTYINWKNKVGQVCAGNDGSIRCQPVTGVIVNKIFNLYYIG